MRIPIKATAHVPIKQAGYISATSAFHARTHLRSAAGPYIWARSCRSFEVRSAPEAATQHASNFATAPSRYPTI